MQVSRNIILKKCKKFCGTSEIKNILLASLEDLDTL